MKRFTKIAHPLLALSLALLSVSVAHAQKSIVDQGLDVANGTRLEMRIVFDPMPPTGYAPVRVVATNGFDNGQRWRFDIEATTQSYPRPAKHSSHFELAVPAHSTQSGSFLVPVAANYQGGSSGYNGGNQTLSISASGGGVGTNSYSHYEERVEGFPAIAISDQLANSSLTKLEGELATKKSGSRGYSGGSDNVFGSRFSLDDLPSDWLGYSGFDYLMITPPEWQRAKPSARQAILQWVRMGGKLHVYVTEGTTPASLGLPDGENVGRRPTSLGRISLLAWDGRELDASAVVTRYWGSKTRQQALSESYAEYSSLSTPKWQLLAALGVRAFASWQVIVFLVVFGILVGPVNLFVLAPPGKRHKLFYTTPILSIGTSLLMVGLILFQDGIGGVGRRFAAINLEPQEATAYVTQEQVSRTGVLLGVGFELKQPTLVQPLALPPSPWVKLSTSSESQQVSLDQAGALYSGNFFQSRAEQGQLLRAAVSTRARMELKSGEAPDTPPSLISALGFPATEMFYVDANGKVWKSGTLVGTGQQVKMTPAQMAELKTWWGVACEIAGPTNQSNLLYLTDDPRGKFFAKAVSAPDFLLPTSSAIRWRDDQIVVFGTVATP